MARKATPTRGRPRVERPAGLKGQFGERLETARKAADLGQAALAEAAGVGLGTVARLESGKASPSLETVVDLAKALGMRARELMAPCKDW